MDSYYKVKSGVNSSQESQAKTPEDECDVDKLVYVISDPTTKGRNKST